MADDPDFEYLIVDSTIIRAHQHAAGAKGGSGDQASLKRTRDEALGRSRGGLSYPRSIWPCVGSECPVRFALTAGQKGDAPQAEALLKDLPAEVVLADAAYGSDRLRTLIADKGGTAVIPNNPSRACKHALDCDLYTERHLIEC